MAWKVYHWGPVKCGLYAQVVFRAGLAVFRTNIDTKYFAVLSISATFWSMPLDDLIA